MKKRRAISSRGVSFSLSWRRLQEDDEAKA